ncbi:hypothetical protein M23134_00993 [Microscilla marina ATCC 23134]|uniref:Uncharacterized protein n=1 Tax=Microscilla marina ATCC 23134 TaxID=313606 RepID=A1ZZH3_MICM2|nr:hypothetical protein M23134_00993 [Microscilla marina ATCC 23134]
MRLGNGTFLLPKAFPFLLLIIKKNKLLNIEKNEHKNLCNAIAMPCGEHHLR